MYAQGYDLPLLAPDTVLLNYIRQSNEELARCYRELGMRVAVMDTEGGILSKKGLREPNAWASSLRDTGLASLVDDYFFWGEAIHAAFLENSGMRPGQLHLTGCPRYDLCAPPWNSALSYPRSGFVLVNTNFSAINPAFTRSAGAEKKIFQALGWSERYISDWFSEIESVFPRYLDEIEALARSMPRQSIVVRPHPFENNERYNRRFAAIDNIEIDGSGDVLNMISAAKCIVHLNCGTAVDALLQRKAPISLEYLNTDLLLDHTPLPSRISLKSQSRDHLIAIVEGLVSGDDLYDYDAAFSEIEPWFYRADGFASARVASVLAGESKQSAKSSFTRAAKGGRSSPSIGQIFQGTASVLFGSNLVGAIRGKITKVRKDKDIRLADVQSLLDFYADADQGPRCRAQFARNPLTGFTLSTIEIHVI
jgi:surface carbohydrate biosynthesis protein